MSKKKLIVIEGSDGVGKSTQVQKIVKRYNAKQIIQPSGTNIVGYLRNIVKNDLTIGPGERQLLHTISHIADMLTHFDGTKNLVMDRCHISALVYGKITGVTDNLNEIIQDIHRSFYEVFVNNYDIHVVFLTRRNKYSEQLTDKFEGTLDWDTLRKAYEAMYDIHNKLPRIFTYEDSDVNETVHRIDVKDFDTDTITEMIVNLVGE